MVKKSEDELNETLDRCLADTALKIVGAGTIGLIVGIVCKRQFPVWLGIGTGFGMGIANCRHDMKRVFLHSKQETEQSKFTVIEEAGHTEIGVQPS